MGTIVDGIILVQRPQIYKSKAASFVNQLPTTFENITEFISPQRLYKLSYDIRYWTIQELGPRVMFNLNKDYGSARLDIIEGESEKDLDSLTQEIIKAGPLSPTKMELVQFQDKPAYLLTYKEQVIGEDTVFYKQIVKEDNKFLVFEKRAPSLGYNNTFLDNLLEGISFTLEPQQVRGIATLPANLTTVQLVDLVRPSIANIVSVYCLDIVNLSPSSKLSKPRYHFCSSQKGSGFIINEQGIVATNGHVVKVYPEEGLVANLLQANGKDLSIDLIRSMYLSKGQNPAQAQIEQFYQDLGLNPQYMDRFLTEIFDLIGKKMLSVSILNETYYINVGNEPVEVAYRKISGGDYSTAVIPSPTTYTAKLVDFDYPNKYSYEAIVNKNYHRGADVAILRINNSTNLFPALELGNTEDLREGSDVVVAGYPTLVEGEKDPRAAISYKTSTKPTITRGIISSVKQDLTGKTILQTDASIDHGNSGGPGFNLSGQVVGIATFMAESKSGNFNFLRDASELKGLMFKNKVENKLGDLSHLWRKGLAEFRDQYYNQAIKNFKAVQTLSPSHPTVKELIEVSEKAVAKGESLEGLASFTRGKHSNIVLVVFGGISIVSFMSAGFLTMLPFFKRY